MRIQINGLVPMTSELWVVKPSTSKKYLLMGSNVYMVHLRVAIRQDFTILSGQR